MGVDFVKVGVWIAALTAVDKVPAVLPAVTSAPQPDVVVQVLPAREASPYAIKAVRAVAFCPPGAARHKGKTGGRHHFRLAFIVLFNATPHPDSHPNNRQNGTDDHRGDSAWSQRCA